MDLIWPKVRIAGCAPRLLDNSARFNSALSGTMRSVSRPGDRVAFRVDLQSLTSNERALLEPVIWNQRGAANRLLFSPPDFDLRGSFGVSEQLTTYFESVGAFTVSGATLVVQDHIARVTNTGAAAGRATTPALTTVSGSYYVARAVALPGNQNNWKLNCGTTAGASDIFSSALTAPGLTQIGFIASGTVAYLSLVCNTSVSGDFAQFTYLSFARAIQVNTGSQTGSQIKVDHLPTSVNGLLLPGDWIGIGMELKKVIAPMNSDSGGNGYIHFSPPLRASPADNSEVVITAPLGRFTLSATESGWEVVPGKFATSSFDLMEAP